MISMFKQVDSVTSTLRMLSVTVCNLNPLEKEHNFIYEKWVGTFTPAGTWVVDTIPETKIWAAYLTLLWDLIRTIENQIHLGKG